MKKIIFLLALAAVVCACGEDAKVRTAITERVKSDLAAPGSFKFVGMERVQTFTIESEAKRAAQLIPDGKGDWIVDAEGNGHYGYPAKERKAAALMELAATMPQDSVVGGVYRFNYRADVPGGGRDFPAELYFVAALDGTIGGVGLTEYDAIYRSPTIVKEFVDFTRYDD